MNKIIRVSGAVALFLVCISVAWAQDGEFTGPVHLRVRSHTGPVNVAPSTAPGTTAPGTSGRTSVLAPAAAVMPTDVLRWHMMDGSVIAGRFVIKQIVVETIYGQLTIPVTDIVSMTPGLDSHPALAAQITGWIEQLGSSDFAQREAAQQALGKLGPAVRLELQRFTKDSDAERRKRIEIILEEMDNNNDDDAPPVEPWIRQDAVQTNLFTVVGKIQPRQFEITSQYGSLKLALTDLHMGKRVGEQAKEELRKQLDVAGSNLVQTDMKSSGLQVSKGDQIIVTAEGSITLPPWGSRAQCGPDGASNYGWYMSGQIPVGCLVARIGSDGSVVKVGSKNTFTADRTGTLFFGVGMQQDYVGNNFGGQYKLKVRVRPR